jgi:PKD repeat protein
VTSATSSSDEITATLGDVPEEGDLLIAWAAGTSDVSATDPAAPYWPAGWTQAEKSSYPDNRTGYAEMRYRFVGAGESAADELTLTTHPSDDFIDVRLYLAWYRNVGEYVESAVIANEPGADPGVPTVMPAQPGAPALLVVAVIHEPDYTVSLSGGYTERIEETTAGGNRQAWELYDLIEEEADDDYGPGLAFSGAGGESGWSLVHAVFGAIEVSPPPSGEDVIASFLADEIGLLEVLLTDTSEGDIVSWAWDFGDGTGSTAQGPHEHTYAAGTYTVILTVTGATDSDSVSATFTIGEDLAGEEPAFPAILEVYLPAGGDEWGSPAWGSSQWSSAAWIDISPEGVTVDWAYGADRADVGLAVETVAGRAQAELYDPERRLDPANSDSDLWPFLVPDTPIRLSHGGTIIRTGMIESLDWSAAEDTGVIAATDDVSTMRRGIVPAGSSLGETLWTLAADAVAAAGLRYPLIPGPGGADDPPIFPADVTDDASVWTHIQAAAAGVFYLPWVDEHRNLRFTNLLEPVDGGRIVDDSIMVDLISRVSDDGLYSVVRCLADDESTVEERSATPTPPYGRRILERTTPTLDAETWCEIMLADRSARRVRYRPGRILALTAADVDMMAAIRIGELVTLTHGPTTIQALAMGIRVKVRSRGRSAWDWYLSLAQETVLEES